MPPQIKFTAPCPRCKKNRYTPYALGDEVKDNLAHFEEYPFPATSRVDNRTFICSACGTAEAIENMQRGSVSGKEKWPLPPGKAPSMEGNPDAPDPVGSSEGDEDDGPDRNGDGSGSEGEGSGEGDGDGGGDDKIAPPPQEGMKDDNAFVEAAKEVGRSAGPEDFDIQMEDLSEFVRACGFSDAKGESLRRADVESLSFGILVGIAFERSRKDA